MKKLIAILIILIFNFESMGYSLPDSVRRGNLRAPAGIDSRRIFYAQGKLKHKKPPYQTFSQALEAFKKGDISWKRTITDDNGIWRKFIETLAVAVGKKPGQLSIGDFQNYSLAVFNKRSIVGLLSYYMRVKNITHFAIALKSLKESLGIEDLLVPRQEWQEKTTDWPAVCGIIREHMAVEVTKDNIERYLTDRNTKLTKAAQLALGIEVQKGNAAAREALIIAYLERVKSFATWQHYRNHDIGEDEFYDAGLRALIGCAERFDPDKSASFKTYCSIRIQYSMKDLIIDKRGYRRSNKTREVPIDENMGSIDARGNNHGIPSIPIEEAGLILSNADISERDIGIFNSFFYEDSKQIDIAKRTVPELTSSRVSQIIAKCVEILKQQLNGPVRYKIPINGNNRQGI